MSFAEKADKQGAEITQPMLFDQEEGLIGFEMRVADDCTFFGEFLQNGIMPFLVKVKPVGEVSERVEIFIQEVQDNLQAFGRN